MDKCKGIFGRIRCNFQPRYDENGSGNFKADKIAMAPDDLATLIRAIKDRTYVCDVCTACGEQRARPELPPKDHQS